MVRGVYNSDTDEDAQPSDGDSCPDHDIDTDTPLAGIANYCIRGAGKGECGYDGHELESIHEASRPRHPNPLRAVGALLAVPAEAFQVHGPEVGFFCTHVGGQRAAESPGACFQSDDQ